MRELGIVWAAGLLLKGTALLLFVFVVAAALRRASAGLRHLVWSGGVAALLLLPVVSLTVPWRLPVMTPVALHLGPQLGVPPLHSVERGSGGEALPLKTGSGNEALSSAGADRESGDEGLPSANGAPKNGPAAAAGPPIPSSYLTAANVMALLLALWIVGALAMLGRLGLGMVVVRRIVRRAAPLASPDWTRPLLEGADRLALDSVPQLLVSERLPMPFACGLLHPAIVLPAGAREWPDRRRRAVLCHELAHIRRLDLAVNVLGQLACAIYWFHPLVWVAARKLRTESERACDDLVLGVGTRASEYADHLLQIVCRAARARTPAVALPMAARREFEGRMLAILEPDARREPPARRHALTLAAFALALIVPLAALGPAARRAAQPEVAKPSIPTTSVAAPPTGRPAPSRVSHQTTAATEQMEHRQTQTLERQDTRVQQSQVAEPQGKGDKTPKTKTAWKSSDRRSDPDPKVVQALIGALQDSVASVRRDAAYALGQLEAKQAVIPLGARLLQDSDAQVRRIAAWALGQIESRDATTALSKAAIEDASAEVRAIAIWALGQIEDPAAVTPLSAALRDSSEEVRADAAWAIGQIEPQSPPPALIAALQDPSPKVRVRVAWALGQIGEGASAAAPALQSLLKDSNDEVRKAAFWAIGQLGEAAQPALIEALKDPSPDIRAAAARALAGGHLDPWPWPRPRPTIR